ncbi:MAG: hypothetical protein WB791_03170 [Waddliaceae bacterium]
MIEKTHSFYTEPYESLLVHQLRDPKQSFRLEETLVKVERTLSRWAAQPVLGIVPGGMKVGLGLAQTVTAIAFTVLTLLPALCDNQCCSFLCKRSFSHIPHGLGNILAGILEAIPWFGRSIYDRRKENLNQNTSDQTELFHTGYEDQYRAYLALALRDGYFDDPKEQDKKKKILDVMMDAEDRRAQQHYLDLISESEHCSCWHA